MPKRSAHNLWRFYRHPPPIPAGGLFAPGPNAPPLASQLAHRPDLVFNVSHLKARFFFDKLMRFCFTDTYLVGFQYFRLSPPLLRAGLPLTWIGVYTLQGFALIHDILCNHSWPSDLPLDSIWFGIYRARLYSLIKPLESFFT